jgi:ammonium transporter Rh
MSKNRTNNKSMLVAILLITVIIAMGFLPSLSHNNYDTISEPGEALGNIYDSLKYEKSIHVLAMLLVGFGFLMVFVRKHGFSSITATFLAVSIALPLYMLVKTMSGEHFSIVSIDSFILAEFAAASLLIAMGAPLGRLNMNQYIVLAMAFIPAYIVNEWIILESGFFTGFIDVGGSVVIHAFGAYFGLGLVSNTLDKFKGQPEADNDAVSDQFSLIGSMILWIFWPSFTSALVAPNEVVITAINTVFALCGATLATYVFSKLLRGKIEIADIANAALAGGVAIGSVCNTTTPGYAMLIGIAAGALSTVGYVFIAPKVEAMIKGTDTCGVHNLHGMPGILGGIFGVFISGTPTLQLIGIVVTVVLGLVFGKVAGMVIGLFGQKMVPYSDEGEFH